MATARYDVAVEACAGQLKAIGGSDPGAEAELFYRLGKLAMIRLDRVSEGLGAMRRADPKNPGPPGRKTHCESIQKSIQRRPSCPS